MTHAETGKTCTPENIFGPYEQTLFLGCSVLGFTATAGWGGQATEVTVELVQDKCNAKAGFYKRVWTAARGATILNDPTLFTGPDPGFTSPNIGAPAYFRVNDFEFAGLIQSYSRKDAVDGNPSYSVKLIDPRPILEHAQVILDTYQGGHQGLYNIFNVYGYLEYVNSPTNETGLHCNDNVLSHGTAGVGTVVGSPARGFGGARKTDRGISWTLIKQALQDLAGGPFGMNFETYSLGALFYRGSSGGGYGELNFPNFSSANAGARYVLDITELPDPYSWDYRITGPVMSLNTLISQVCEDAGADFYVELLPSDQSLVIKVRTVLRTESIGSSTVISNFVASKNIEAGGQGVVSHTVGRELRSDVNSSLLIGGQARQYFEQEDPSYLAPFWGYDNDGNLIQGRQGECNEGANDECKQYIKFYELPESHGCDGCVNSDVNSWRVLQDFRKLNLLLTNMVPHLIKNSFGYEGFGWILEVELRWAMGDYDEFVCRLLRDCHQDCDRRDTPEALFASGYTVLKYYFKHVLGMECPNGVLQVKPSDAPTRAAKMGVDPAKKPPPGSITSLNEKDGQAVYEWVKQFANEYYGRKFATLIPGVCVINSTITDPTIPVPSPATIITTYSDEPSTEGGWPSLTDGKTALVDNLNILDIPTYSNQIERFKDDVGKLLPIVKYESTGQINYASLPQTDYVTTGVVAGTALTGTLWVKADIDDKWIEGSPIFGDSHYNGANNGGGRKLSAQITLPSMVEVIGTGIKTNQAPVVIVDMASDSIDGDPADVSITLGGHSVSAGAIGAEFEPPVAIGVPLKSNTRTYGPWFAVGSNPGSVHCDIDDGLVPWEYGGIAFMNAAGIAKIKNSATAMQFGDRGEVTVPGYPQLSIGSALPSAVRDALYYIYGGRSLSTKTHVWPRLTATYGEVNWQPRVIPAGGGANVTSINVTVGVQGVSTTYTVSTFTPVFGRFSKANSDRIRDIGKNRLTAIRDGKARDAFKRDIKAALKRGGHSDKFMSAPAVQSKTPSVWFAGKLTHDGTRKIVLAPETNDLAYNTDYHNTSIMTMDGFFRPASVQGGVSQELIDAGSGMFVPRINQQNPTGDVGQYASLGYNQTSAPPPPVNEYTGLPIRQKYLDFLGDPYYNKGLFDDYRSQIEDDAGTLIPAEEGYDGVNLTGAHDIEGVARQTVPWMRENTAGSGSTSLMFRPNSTNANQVSGYSDDYRFLAHRGPLVVHGWGYDIYGKPVPNASGDEGAITGNFSTSYAGLSDRFQDNWLGDARNWPVAPVDLRFDRKRGVWTIPPAFRLYQVESVNGATAGGSGTFEIVKSKDDLCDGSGNPIASGYPTILAENWSSVGISKTEKNVAYYDSPSSSYWLLGGGGGKVVAGVSASGTPAVYNNTYRTLLDGCIYIWPFVKPNKFDTGVIYIPDDKISFDIDVFNSETNYLAGAETRFTGDGPLCQYHSYVAPTGQIPGPFDTGAWTRSGCATSIQFINTGITNIGPGDFSIDSGWQRATGETYLDTGCTVSWNHGMFTTPVQGHYVEGGAGNDILVWYDCEIMKGWNNIT